MTTNLQKKNTPSLVNRIIFTVSLLTIVRAGNFISIPYIDQELFTNLNKENNLILNPLSNLLNSFSGGKSTSLNLFSLGILPYINASIIIQLLTTINPQLERLSKDDGEYGRRKIKQYTRSLTFLCAIIEAIGITSNLKSFIFNWNFLIASQITLCLVSGSMIMLWFSELITKNGLKNGPSLLICFNIVANVPSQLILLKKSFNFSTTNDFKTIFYLIIVFIIYRLIIAACIFHNEGIIRIPLVSPKQVFKYNTEYEKNYIQKQNNLPLRVNQAGIMPLIITSSLMTIFSSFLTPIKFQLTSSNFILLNNLKSIISYFPNFTSKILFWIVYGILILFFSRFYSKLILNPKDIMEQLRKNSVIIKDINPGIETQQYLTKTIDNLAKINAIFFMSIIIPLELVYKYLNIPSSNINGFGLTSQIILINVLIDTFRVIRTFDLAEEEIINQKENI